MTTTATRTDSPPARTSSGAATAYSIVMDVVLLGIVALAAMAGEFLQKDGARDSYKGYINAHSLISEVTEGLVFVAAIIALVKFRRLPLLAIGTPVLLVAMLFNGYLGGQIVDHGKDSYTIVHVPLAVAITALAVWLVTQGIALRKGRV